MPLREEDSLQKSFFRVSFSEAKLLCVVRHKASTPRIGHRCSTRSRAIRRSPVQLDLRLLLLLQSLVWQWRGKQKKVREQGFVFRTSPSFCVSVDSLYSSKSLCFLVPGKNPSAPAPRARTGLCPVTRRLRQKDRSKKDERQEKKNEEKEGGGVGSPSFCLAH